MEKKKNFVSDVANALHSAGTTIPVPQLANLLNAAGFQTGYSSDYKGERGTYRLVQSVYHELVADGRQADADVVSTAFTKPDGDFAY